MATSAADEYSIDRKLSALVEQARPSAAAMRAAAEAVDAVAELIRRVQQQQATPEAARGFVRDLGLELEAEMLSFTFRLPEVVRLAGSHAAGAVARPDVAADLLVRLPKCTFSKTFKLWYGSVGGDAVDLTWENPKKCGREEADETAPKPTSILKEVGDVGKGLVRGVYLVKAPKLQ